MIEGLLYAMIGSWGLAVIDWATNNPGWIVAGFSAWATMFALGKLQLKSIRTKTESWVLESSKQVIAKSPDITIERLYEQLYPEWIQNLRGSAAFIMHRWELWPVPATPRFVKARIDFSAEWLGGFLWMNGIKLPGSKAPEEKVSSKYLPKVQK